MAHPSPYGPGNCVLRTASLIGARRRQAEDLVAVFLLRPLWLKANHVAEATDFVLETRDNADRQFVLLATKAIRVAYHPGTLHCLSMPVIALQAALEMGVLFGLQEVVVVALLRQEVRLVVAAVVADEFGYLADPLFVLVDKVPVFLILGLEVLNATFLPGQLKFKVGDTRS